MDAIYSAQALAGLNESTRAIRLRELEELLSRTFGEHLTPDQFFEEADQVIEALRSLGHDLWSFEGNGDTFELWCGDYTEESGGGPLIVRFTYPSKVEVGWCSSRAG